MRHYFVLLVFGLMLSEALSLETGINHGEPENNPEPFNQNLDDRDEDLEVDDENEEETRDATHGQNEGEPDYTDHNAGEPDQEKRDLGHEYLELMPEEFEGPGRIKRSADSDEMDGDDLLEPPNDVWDNEQNQSGVAGNDAAKVARQSGPPSTACMSVKLIFNNGWVQSAGNGNVALAEQRARDVFAEANNIYQNKYSTANRLGTSITFNLVGGAPVHDSTGSYQATGSALQTSDILNNIDTSSFSTQHYAFLTGYDGSGAIGIAYVGTPCLRLSGDQRYKTSINEWYNNVHDSAGVLAHEMGHALGMYHDFGSGGTSDIKYDSNGNACTRINGLMDYGSRSRVDKFTTCSREDFAAWYTRVMGTYGSFCLTCANNPTQAPTQAPTTQAPTQAPTTITPGVCNGVPNTDWSCCTRKKPCNIGGGDCDSDSDCAGNLKCGTDNCAADFSSPGSNWGLVADCCFGATPAPTSAPGQCNGVPNVDWSCCTSSSPCDVGGGDCDYDSDCSGDLTCGNNNCKRDYSSPGSNWHSVADCCETPPPRCSGVPYTDWSCCTNSEPCDVGGGDCDSDSHCMAGLKCGNNNCKRDFSSSGSNWARSADCCETAPTTTTSAPAPPCSGDPTTDWACCSSSSPCDVGGGDCDSDSDCAGDLTCGNDNCKRDYSSAGSNWSRFADCCEAAPPRCSGIPRTDWACCKPSEPCDVGMGDCDRDSDCMAGLTCGSNNCLRDYSSTGSNWARAADCCEGTAAPTTAAPTAAPTTAAPTAAPTTAPPQPSTAAPTTAPPAAPTTAPPAPTTCGVKPHGIVGGGEVTPYSLPWQVALVSKGGNRPFCGGTLISATHVLTAAHCTGSSNFDIIVGEHSITDSSDGTRHEVCRVTNHPSYNSPSQLNNDFSIVVLRTPVTLGARAVPACLPDSSHAGDTLAGQSLTVSGWGRLSSGGSQPNGLHKVSVPAITNAACSQAYASYSITNAMICAGNVQNGGVDSCQGDSGGPLTHESNGKTTLVGVVSWGIGCAQAGYPGVYARVTEALTWINGQMAQGCSK